MKFVNVVGRPDNNVINSANAVAPGQIVVTQTVVETDNNTTTATTTSNNQNTIATTTVAPPPPTIIPCENLKDYEPLELEQMINNGTHQVAPGCLYPCYYKGEVLNKDQVKALTRVSIIINTEECPCPEGQEKDSNGICVDIVETPPPLSAPQTTIIPAAEDPFPLPEDNGSDDFDTTGQCSEGQTWNKDKGKCEDINPCSPGFIYDPTDKENPCKQPFECDESRGLRKNPQTGQCESICKTGEYWDGRECVPIPQCGEGTVLDPETNKCIPSFEQITCGDGTIRQGNVCVSISGPPDPAPSFMTTFVGLPPDSGSPIDENPDPDNFQNKPTILESQNCEDAPPPPPPLDPVDRNRPTKTISSTGRHLYVIQNKIGTEQKYVNYPYRAAGVDDILRAVTGYFWYFDDRFLRKFLFSIYRNIDNPIEGLTRYLQEQGSQIWDTGLNIETFTFYLTGIKNNISLSNIENFDVRKFIFEDYAFTSNQANEQMPFSLAPFTFTKNSIYNYYIGSYERLLNSPNSPELYNLPNYYLLSLNETEDEQPNFGQMSSREDRRVRLNLLNIGNEIKEQYYDNYVDKWLNNVTARTTRQKNIVFETNGNFNLLDENLFPFFNKFSFNLEKDKRLIYNDLDTKNEEKMLNCLIFILIMLESGILDSNFRLPPSKENYAYQDKFTGEAEENKVLFTTTLENITNILTRLYNDGSFYEFLRSQITILKDLDISTRVSFQQILQENMQTFINFENTYKRLTQKRNYIDTIKGKECYSETLIYKIEKYEEGTEESIQNIWLSNDDKEIFNYIDTQVKYNTNYTYVVKAYKYVLGNEYRYFSKDISTRSIRDGTSYELRVSNKPKGKIIATEYARIPGIVIDKPPAAPEIDVIPYKNNDEKVLVLFNPSSVEYRRVPVVFNDQERQFYERIRYYQRSQDEKITFGGDDKTNKYYVYRIEKHPSSYDDFSDALYAEIEPECNCTTAEYIQRLEANKKYYFVFRSVDVHGHISYPTRPFLVELISEGGTIFLDFRGVDFVDKDYKSLTKGAKRFIHIKPNLQQSLLRITDVDKASAHRAIATRQYDLGQEELENRIWGKNFKLKIKSKNTKKEINIKFKFVKKENKDLIRNLEESCE